MRRLSLLVIGTAVIGLAALASAPAGAAGLTLVVDKLRSAGGTVHLALWSSAKGFTEAEFALIHTERPAARGQVRFDLGRLAPGPYAVAAYHDENGNGKFDQTLIGWPDEGLGFSNGAWIALGAPSFEEAAFEVRPGTQVVSVSLRYPSARPAAGRTSGSQ